MKVSNQQAWTNTVPARLLGAVHALKAKYDKSIDAAEVATGAFYRQSLFANWTRVPPKVGKEMSRLALLCGQDPSLFSRAQRNQHDNPGPVISDGLEFLWRANFAELTAAFDMLHKIAKGHAKHLSKEAALWARDITAVWGTDRQTHVFLWLRRVLDRDSLAKYGEWEAPSFIGDRPFLIPPIRVCMRGEHWDRIGADLTLQIIGKLQSRYCTSVREEIDERYREVLIAEALTPAASETRSTPASSENGSSAEKENPKAHRRTREQRTFETAQRDAKLRKECKKLHGTLWDRARELKKNPRFSEMTESRIRRIIAMDPK